MIQDRLTQITFSKQSALGTPATSGGAYRVGVRSGQVAKVDISEDDIGTTWSSRLSEGVDRGDVNPGAVAEIVAMAKSVGLLLVAALGTDTPTGSGPYAHAMTVGSVLPYLTAFGLKGTEFFSTSDNRIDELEFTWTGTKALVVKVTLKGCTFTFLGSSDPGSATDERPSAGVLKGCGGTFTVGGTAAIVNSGSIKITNNLTQVHGSATALPSDVYPGVVAIEYSLVITPSDLNLFRSAVSGSATGASPSCKPFVGSAECSFSDGTNTLDFNTSQLVSMVEFPDTSADGGPVQITLAGKVQSGSGAFTATLTNTVATY